MFSKAWCGWVNSIHSHFRSTHFMTYYEYKLHNLRLKKEYTIHVMRQCIYEEKKERMSEKKLIFTENKRLKKKVESGEGKWDIKSSIRHALKGSGNALVFVSSFMSVVIKQESEGEKKQWRESKCGLVFHWYAQPLARPKASAVDLWVERMQVFQSRLIFLGNIPTCITALDDQWPWLIRARDGGELWERRR